MGVEYSIYNLKDKPDWLPHTNEKPTFDESYGFSKPRQERVMVATEDEMRAAKVPLDKRDYCAHLYIEYASCKRTYWPFPVMCKPEKHKYFDCEYEDYVLRMKEFEREKRLRLRQARLEGK